jgi:hypothetical protein
MIGTGKLIGGFGNLVNPVNHVDVSLLANISFDRAPDGWHGNCWRLLELSPT